MEPVEQDDAAAGQHHRHGRIRHRIDVRHRQRRQQPVLAWAQRAQAADPGVPAAAAQVVVVGQHAALGLAGGTRGIDQGAFRRGVWLDIVRLRRGRRQRSVIRRRGASVQPCQMGSGADGQADAAVLHQVGKLRRSQLGAERHDAGADLVQRQPVQKRRRPVLKHQADAMPDAVPGGAICHGQRCNRAGRGTVGHFTRADMVTTRGLVGDAEERSIVPGPHRVMERGGNRGGSHGAVSGIRGTYPASRHRAIPAAHANLPGENAPFNAF